MVLDRPKWLYGRENREKAAGTWVNYYARSAEKRLPWEGQRPAEGMMLEALAPLTSLALFGP